MKLKVYKTTLIISVIVILVAFIMKLCGCSDFDIPIIDNAINNNLLIKYICYGLLYTLHSIIVIILIIKRKLSFKEIILLIIIFMIIYLINGFLNLGYIKFIIEMIAFTIPSYIMTKNKKIPIEVFMIYFLNFIYQLISMLTKNLTIGIYKETFTTNLIFQIDYYMLLIISVLYFLKKGEHVYEIFLEFIKRWRMGSFNLIHSKRNCKEKCIQQNQTSNQEVDFEISYAIFNIVLAIFQILTVGFVCWLIKNTIINFIVIYLSFVFLRKVLGHSYHADTVIKCTTLSIFIFACATELSLDINFSLLSSVLSGLLTAIFLHILYYYNNFIKGKNDITKLDLNELKIRLGYLEQIEIEMLYDYWHRGSTTVDEVAEKYGYNKMKVYRTLKKIKYD